MCLRKRRSERGVKSGSGVKSESGSGVRSERGVKSESGSRTVPKGASPGLRDQKSPVWSSPHRVPRAR